MSHHDEDAAIHVDAYIDALLARPRVMPVDLPPAADAPARRTAALLSQLPRFHPSFAFEEALGARLRELAAGTAEERGRLAEVIAFPGSVRPAMLPTIDRRLIVGGAAIASGVSVAAVIALWQAARRPRPGAIA
jgi:hypothetical protein